MVDPWGRAVRPLFVVFMLLYHSKRHHWVVGVQRGSSSSSSTSSPCGALSTVFMSLDMFVLV